MTLDDFVLMTLGNRIKWLHSAEGPHGKLSHDKFAAILGTSRQAIIGWEKGSSEPRDFRKALAEFSGFPEEAFSRRGAEVLVEELSRPRLQAHEARLETAEALLDRVVAALAAKRIPLPGPEGSPQSLPSARQRGRATRTQAV